MYSYQAYDLGFHSQFKLFEFPTSEAADDVVIRRDNIHIGSNKDLSTYPYLRISPNETILSVDSIGVFLIRDGNEIIVDPIPGANQTLLLRNLLGPGIAILLYQRGNLVLHASSVSINGEGVLFLGGSGTGKSSTAAAHLSHGHQFLVDDVASIDFRDQVAWVHPGFPQIKLDDSAAVTFVDSHKYQYMDDLEDKKNFLIIKSLCPEKVELKHVYVLMDGGQLQIERFDSQRGLIEIVRNSIPPSMVNFDKAGHLTRCLKLINCVTVSGLRRSNSLNGLQELVTKLEDTIKNEA